MLTPEVFKDEADRMFDAPRLCYAREVVRRCCRVLVVRLKHDDKCLRLWR